VPAFPVAPWNLWGYKGIMSTIDNIKKRSKGRPPVDSAAITVRVERAQLTAIDDWRRRQGDLPNRPEAIRRLVAAGLSRAAGKRE
jgi:hypothetical protein